MNTLNIPLLEFLIIIFLVFLSLAQIFADFMIMQMVTYAQGGIMLELFILLVGIIIGEI